MFTKFLTGGSRGRDIIDIVNGLNDDELKSVVNHYESNNNSTEMNDSTIGRINDLIIDDDLQDIMNELKNYLEVEGSYNNLPKSDNEYIDVEPKYEEIPGGNNEPIYEEIKNNPIITNKASLGNNTYMEIQSSDYEEPVAKTIEPKPANNKPSEPKPAKPTTLPPLKGPLPRKQRETTPNNLTETPMEDNSIMGKINNPLSTILSKKEQKPTEEPKTPVVLNTSTKPSSGIRTEVNNKPRNIKSKTITPPSKIQEEENKPTNIQIKQEENPLDIAKRVLKEKEERESLPLSEENKPKTVINKNEEPTMETGSSANSEGEEEEMWWNNSQNKQPATRTAWVGGNKNKTKKRNHRNNNKNKTLKIKRF
jgi:hypothetical protein